MKTYFEEKFQSLVVSFGYEESLIRVVNVLLFQPSIPYILKNKVNKFTDFWSSSFVMTLSKEHLSTENFIFALGQYIGLLHSSIDTCILQYLLKIDEESVINAVRLSGIIMRPDHDSWSILKETANQAEASAFNEFLNVVEYIQLKYKERFNDYIELKNNLQLDPITAMIFSSLYTYEYLIIDTDYLEIPYQIDVNDNIGIEDVWGAFHELITSSNIERNKLTEEQLAKILKAKMTPFLFSENINHFLMKEYDNFKKLIAHKIEINLYQDKVFGSYCYDLSKNYHLNNGQLILESKSHNLDYFQDKLSILSVYWQLRGLNALESNPYFERLDRGENFESNAHALAKTQGIVLQVYEIYGIEKAVFEQNYDLYSLVFTMLLSQAYYVQDFVEAFKKIRDSNNNHAFSNLNQLMMNGFLIDQNRMPITFATQKEKSIKMSDWIIEGDKSQKIKDMSRILNFWAYDLLEDNGISYSEKTFYKIDEYLFSLPWMSARKNFNTAIINTFRKNYKNRSGLKSETDLMEKNLAGLLDRYESRVYSQHEPSESGVGEIDAIVVTNNKVLIIELKSTYIKKSFQERYSYRSIVLKKAAYQLSRKTSYVREVFLPHLGLDASKLTIHSWIVDTTLEFDHEYIDGFLKISFEELVIILNGHKQYLSNMLDNDNTNKNPLSAYEENLEALIESVEGNTFWTTNLPLINSIQESNNASTLKA